MIINFELAGENRKVKWDGKCFIAYDSKDGALGYYTTIGNAVLCHIKDAANKDSATDGKEEVMTLLELVDRMERLWQDVRQIDPVEIPTYSFIDVAKRGAHFLKENKQKAQNKPTESTIASDDDDL